MTVNERLVEAKLLDAYECARASDDTATVDAVLQQVDLQRDENGMHWPMRQAGER